MNSFAGGGQLSGGQLNGEGGALAWFTLDGNPSIMRPYGFLHDCQSEPGPSSGLFGGEKRLKDLCRMVRLDAVPCVGDFDCDRPRLVQASTEGDGIGGRCPQTQRAAVGHRLQRIFNEMIDRFLHMLAVRLDGRKIRGQFGNASNVLAFAFGPKEAGAFA